MEGKGRGLPFVGQLQVIHESIHHSTVIPLYTYCRLRGFARNEAGPYSSYDAGQFLICYHDQAIE